jgi:biopolymer transport protein ExbD
MHKTLILIIFSTLLSCSDDCSECENKLKMIMHSETIPVDLPAPTQVYPVNDESVLRIEVTAENKYVFDGELYEYENLEPVIYNLIGTPELADEKIKIEGHPQADYEAVFKLIAFCKENSLSPVLVFKGE